MAGLVVDGVCVEESIRQEIKKKKKAQKGTKSISNDN